MSSKLVVSILLVGLALIFILQNATVVSIDFFFWSISMPRSLFMFVLLVIGLIAGWMGRSFVAYRDSFKNQTE